MIQIGDRKVTSLMVGGSVMVNQENVWLPCEINAITTAATAKMPVVMHYDSSNDNTQILGGFSVPIANGSWSGNVITLPEGFHFLDVIDIPFWDDAARQLHPSFKVSESRRTISATLENVDYGLRAFNVLFGELDWRSVYNWSTTKIEPD